MENNNRQGCRWTKASERLPEVDNKNPKHYIFLNDVNHQATNIYTGFIDSFPSMITNYLFDWKWLDESIETCATSSENYWKQRCESAERVSFNYMEQLKAAEAYAYMAFSKITGVMSGDEEKLFNEWQQIKNK